MHLQKFLTIGLIALLACGGTAYAALTGVLAGTATDVDGNPIPGVTVTVTGPNLPGARVDTTSENGMYRMPELTPGLYEVKAELMGMKTVEKTNVKVSLNSTTRINFTMEMTPFEETVVVVGKAQVLDVKSTTMKSTIERTVTERLPGSDSFQEAFGMAGGINGGGNVRVHGSSKQDNVYMFDGFDATDPVTGTFGANLNADAIEETEVQTGGFTAEYGRAMGGIVNVVTKSGGNEFHGIFRLKYNNASWHSPFKHPQAESDYKYWEPTVTIEGPILKDKLWFMVTYNYNKRDDTVKVLENYNSDFEKNELRAVDASREFILPYGKLTYQANQSHKLVFAYSGEDATIYGDVDNPNSMTWETVNVQEQGGPLYSLEWTWLYSSNLYFVSRAAVQYGVLDNKPMFDGSKPQFRDNYWETSYNGSLSSQENDRNSYQYEIVGNYFVEDLAGSHDFKSGIQYIKSEVKKNSSYPGGAQYTIDSKDTTDATRTRALGYDPDNPYAHSESLGDYYSFFIQDDWSIRDNMTLNIGLRYELVNYETSHGGEVPAWSWGQWNHDDYISGTRIDENGFERSVYRNTTPCGFDDMLAPRIGFNWDINGDGKMVARAYYGRFYNPYNLQLVDMFQPFEANLNKEDQRYTGPAWTDSNNDGVPDNPEFYDDANWQTYSTDSPSIENLMDPDLKSEYTDEYSFGIEREIIDNLSIGFSYTHRETNDMIEDCGLFIDENGNIVWTYLGGVNDARTGIDPAKNYDPREEVDYTNHIYWITNAEDNKREYDGLEINAKARMKHFDLQASYTWSEVTGATTESQPGSGISQFSGYYDTYAFSHGLQGKLPWNSTNYLKINASYHNEFTDWYEFSFGVSMFERTGYSYSKLSVPPKTFDPDDPSNDYNDRSTWTGKPPYATWAGYLPEGRGTYEYPEVINWDISLQNTFKFGKFGALTAIFDVTNLFDNQGVGLVNETEPRKHPENFGQELAWFGPREWVLTFKYTF